MTSADHNQTSEDRSVIDVSKIQDGDELHIKVRADGTPIAGQTHIRVLTGSGLKRSLFSVQLHTIVSHTPRQIQVGDRVRARMPASRASYCVVGGEVVAIHDGNAWVRLSVGGYLTGHISELEREP